MKYLAGIKPTGELHLGNYVSIIKPALETGINNTLFLIADLHSLIDNKSNIFSNSLEIAKTLYSFGAKNIVLQSSFPEISELNWILSCYTPKGLMNRAHRYKDIQQLNNFESKPLDEGINMGLFNYPVLMAADLCIFDCDYVFVGEDQLQHIEMANDIIKKSKLDLKVAYPIVKDVTVYGYDGMKMSKSYNNTIPLITDQLKNQIFSMKTNSKRDGVSKYWNESPVCTLYNAFASRKECKELEYQMEDGLGWGKVKQIVYEKVDSHIKDARERYNDIKDWQLDLLLSKNAIEIQKDITYPKIEKIKEQLFYKE